MKILVKKNQFDVRAANYQSCHLFVYLGPLFCLPSCGGK